MNMQSRSWLSVSWVLLLGYVRLYSERWLQVQLMHCSLEPPTCTPKSSQLSLLPCNHAIPSRSHEGGSAEVLLLSVFRDTCSSSAAFSRCSGWKDMISVLSFHHLPDLKRLWMTSTACMYLLAMWRAPPTVTCIYLLVKSHRSTITSTTYNSWQPVLPLCLLPLELPTLPPPLFQLLLL